MPRFIHPSTTLWAFCLAWWSAYAQAQSGGMGDIMSDVFDSTLAGEAVTEVIVEGRASFYEPSRQISEKVREQILETVIARMPHKEQQLRQVFGQTDAMAFFDREAIKRGYEPNDLALALTAWLTISYGILNERQTTEDEDRAVWRQLRAVINGDPNIANLPDAEKQTAAEILVWTGAMSQFDYDQAVAGTPGYSLDKVQAYVHENLMQFGLPPDRFTITNLGVTPVAADSAAGKPSPGGTPTATGSAVPTQGIEGVGFIQVYRSGPEIVPVVLFANGEACRDMALLSGNKTIAAHKAANPDAWTKWRRQGGKLQILKKQGWSDFPFQNATGPFDDGYSLNRRYNRLNTISIDVDNRAASTNTYTFAADGTFTHGRSAFATSNVGETGATIAHVPEDQRGEYRIDGYLLTLAYADGKQVVKAIVTDDPDDPSVIWLDGYSYVGD